MTYMLFVIRVVRMGKTLPKVLSTVLGNRPIWLSPMPHWAECR